MRDDWTPRGDPHVQPTWPAPAGTVHAYCNRCSYWFASRGGAKTCPDCTVGTARRDNETKQARKRLAGVSSPFDPGLVSDGSRPVRPLRPG